MYEHYSSEEVLIYPPKAAIKEMRYQSGPAKHSVAWCHTLTAMRAEHRVYRRTYKYQGGRIV